MDTSYQQILEKFPAGIIRGLLLYDYRNDPMVQVYERFYSRYNEHLQYKSKALGFPDTYLYFADNDSKNARATTGSTFKAIGMYRGLMEKMYQFFKSQQTLLEGTDFADVRAVLQPTGEPAEDAFMEYFLMFAYYHEYAHLVQRSPINGADHSEDSATIPSPAEVPESHAREMDADWWATNMVALQLAGAFTDEESHWIGGNGADLVTLASVALCSIFCFFVQAAQKYTDVYFGEQAHPHPLIRIAFIAQYMGKVIRKNLPAGVGFDEASALRKALFLAEKMLTPVYGDAVARLAEQLERHHAAIEQYGNQIIDKALSIPGMCGSRPPTEL